VTYLRAAREAGLRRAVVSARANAPEVLASAGLDDFIEIRVDGQVAAAEGLRGKPYPDTFLAAAKRLGADPTQAAVFEDATAGVQAGRDGGFGFVVGVDRVGQADALRAHGASIVVLDLADLLSGATS
jgi:HAD superfamily hydrolase (TIGR01509 family)